MEVGYDMLVLVTYDISTESSFGQKRLRKVAKLCQNYGIRVQNSVFECQIDSAELVKLRHSLELVIDKEYDSLRFYNLGNNYKNKVIHIGTKSSFDMNEPLIL